MNRTVIQGIGLMSGTSLDGLDIAHCTFENSNGKWSFRCNATEVFDLPAELRAKLTQATEMPLGQIEALDAEVGHFFADSVLSFLKSRSLTSEFIASHGITVFHQPQNGLTLQIGSGQIIADKTGITTINDFRSEDVKKGGQGAPLVPYPDSLLFSGYDATLNLGGFANIAILNPQKLIGYDICVCNKSLNDLIHEYDGSAFDTKGSLSRTGVIDQKLLSALNALPFYQKSEPKSLGHEWYVAEFLPLIKASTAPITNKLRTVVEHVAIQIADNLDTINSVLITGGGAHNKFLTDRIRFHTSTKIILPDPQIIDFKEAIDFAFLGALRLRSETNIKASVTGASSDSIAGSVYQP